MLFNIAVIYGLVLVFSSIFHIFFSFSSLHNNGRLLHRPGRAGNIANKNDAKQIDKVLKRERESVFICNRLMPYECDTVHLLDRKRALYLQIERSLDGLNRTK